MTTTPVRPLTPTEDPTSEVAEHVHGAIAWSSFFFALLQSVCTFFFAANGLRFVVGLGSLVLSAGAGAMVDRFHADALRVPMICLALVGSLLNLAVVAQVRRLRRRPASQWRHSRPAHASSAWSAYRSRSPPPPSHSLRWKRFFTTTTAATFRDSRLPLLRSSGRRADAIFTGAPGHALQFVQRARPVFSQQARQTAVRQHAPFRLAASAVIGLIVCIADALDRIAAPRTWLPIAPMHRHLLAERGHLSQETRPSLLP